MKKAISICMLLVVLVSLSSCGEDYISGTELFYLPDQLNHIELRHNGLGYAYINSPDGRANDGAKLATYNRLLKSLALTPTSRKSELDRSIYEISFSVTIREEYTNKILDTKYIRIIIKDDLVLYDDQWYEANTARLLRQLERDFADVA